MKLCLKITAGLLLLVQAIHLASLQYTTDSPRQPIDPSWLRELAKNTAGSQNAAKETEYDPSADATAVESSNDYSSGIASGFMTLLNEDDENATSQEQTSNEGSDDLTNVTTTLPPTVQNNRTKQPELQNATVSPTNATTYPTNSSQTNKTNAEEEFHNSTMTPQTSTTHLSAQNNTGLSDPSNHTELQTTTLAPESNVTQESTTKPDEDTWLANATESTNRTTVTTTVTPETNKTTTTSTKVFLSETTETSPVTTTTTVLSTSEKGNLTDNGSAAGSSSERGLDSDSHRSKRKGAWAAVLGTMVAVACVGLVAYFILKKKHRKGFTHRKLVEEYPSDPVLRLDNSDPLDLNFGGSAYYNPGLQGDNIQMTNIPGRY